jgi:protease IV
VSMSSTAASGGYYIAAGADEIWAAPTTITGSIGVFAAIPTFQRTLEKLGVHVDGVGTTKLSGEFRLDRPMGGDVRQILQAGVENAYEEFLGRVAKSRKKTVAQIDAVAQGRVWAGSEAHARGLVDRLGTLEAAIKSAAARAKLGDEYNVRYFDPELTWQQALAMEFRSRTAALMVRLGFGDQRPALVRRVLDPLEREIARWARFNDPRNLYSYCFCAAP